MELTILMPCLNEAETLALCIRKALRFLNENGVQGEVLIADNGSTDGSREIAELEGARVVNVPSRGYGAALLGGIQAAHGRFVIMGDADNSYDFLNLTLFLQKLRSGADLVIGNRFEGGIAPGAMPPLHRHLGNPVLSAIGRTFFDIRIGDFHCGLRGFNRNSVDQLNLRTTGMEFASEMIVKASLSRLKIEEVPTKLQPDGRSRAPHLRMWRDGWRHLIFLLMYSPRWLFIYPGLTLLILGLVGSVSLFFGPLSLLGINLDLHTYIVACFAILIGTQAISFGILVRRFATKSGFMPRSKRYSGLMETLTLERALIASAIIFLLGGTTFFWCLSQWVSSGFGPLEYSAILRLLILSVTAVALGIQGALMAFLAVIVEIPTE